MELDYKELQALGDARKKLSQQQRLFDGRRVAWAIVPLLVVSQLLAVQNHHSAYYVMLVAFLIAWAVVFSVTEAISQRQNTKQMSALLNVAQRVMESDPVNQQKLNELQVLNTVK
jgi:hypothetical protein